MMATHVNLEGVAKAASTALAGYGLTVEVTRSVERPSVDGWVIDTTGLKIESRFSVSLDAERLKREFGPALSAAADAVIGARMDALLAAHYAQKQAAP